VRARANSQIFSFYTDNKLEFKLMALAVCTVNTPYYRLTLT